MDNRERQAAFKAAMRSKGFVAATEWVPSEHRELFRSAARALRDGSIVTIGAATEGDTGNKAIEPSKPPGRMPRAADEPKADTVEGQLKAEAKSAGVSVPELILRKVAENMYWLNVMLSRDLNGGTTTTAQTTIDQQAEMFAAWVESFHEASGRTSVRTHKEPGSITVDVKPFKSAPVNVALRLGVGTGNATPAQATEGCTSNMKKQATITRKMEAEIDARVQAQLTEAVAMMQEQYDRSRAIEDAHAGVFEDAEYRALLSALHPDRCPPEHTERNAKAFHLVKSKEALLCRPKPVAGPATLPASVADLVARRKGRK